MKEEEIGIKYKVVINEEEQYSIWPDHAVKLPLGWKYEGKEGDKDECLSYIQEVWKDMRPLSLRRKMEEWEKEESKYYEKYPERKLKPIEIDLDENDNIDYFNMAMPPNELVRSLMKPQEVVVIRYRYKKDGTPNLQRFKIGLNDGYVLVKFTETKGGTELGLHLGESESRLDPENIEWNEKENFVKLKGKVVLDYTPIRVHVKLDINTFQGIGWAEVIPNFIIKDEYDAEMS